MHTKPKQGTPFRLNQSMLMNIPVEYNGEYEQKRLSICFFLQHKNHHLYSISIPALKLDMQGLRVSITEGVCWGTVPTAYLSQILNIRPELPWAELAH